MRVERVGDVKGEGGKPWPNLLDKAEGSTLRVQVPGSAAAGLDVADGRVHHGRRAARPRARPSCSPTPRRSASASPGGPSSGAAPPWRGVRFPAQPPLIEASPSGFFVPCLGMATIGASAMSKRIRGWHVVVGLQLAVLVAAACGAARPRRPRPRRGVEGQPHRGELPGRRRGLLPRHGRRPPAHARRRSRAATRGSCGPAATIASGTPSRSAARHVRPAEDGVVAPEARLRAPQPLEVPRPRQRAVLHRGDRARSEPLRPVARRPRPEVPARPVRERGRTTRASRSARAARPCRSAPTTASRPASSACGCSPTRPSTRRRGSAGTPSATTTIRTTTSRATW